MIRPVLLAAAAVAAVSLAACNPQENTATPDANPEMTVPTPANEAAAVDFVPKAADSDMYEVEAGKIAATKATHADVKSFAAMMVAGHTATTNELKTALTASASTIVPPAALTADKQSMLDALRNASAADFDKTYIDQQVDAHQATLDLMTRYAADGDVEQIKAFAAATAPKVQEHLTEAKRIQAMLDAM